MMKPLKQIILATSLVITPFLLFGSVNYGRKNIDHINPTSYNIEEHDVDQVFRDHDGYRTYFDDMLGKLVEKKYFHSGTIQLPRLKETALFKDYKIKRKRPDIIVYKDLEKNETGYARALYFSVGEGTLERILAGRYGVLNT